MPSEGYVTGTDGSVLLPSGILAKVLDFTGERDDREVPNVGVGDAAESGILTTYRWHFQVVAHAKTGGQTLGQQYANVNMLFVWDPASTDGQCQGLFNLTKLKILSKGGDVTTFSFMASSQGALTFAGPNS